MREGASARRSRPAFVRDSKDVLSPTECGHRALRARCGRWRRKLLLESVIDGSVIEWWTSPAVTAKMIKIGRFQQIARYLLTLAVRKVASTISYMTSSCRD